MGQAPKVAFHPDQVITGQKIKIVIFTKVWFGILTRSHTQMPVIQQPVICERNIRK